MLKATCRECPRAVCAPVGPRTKVTRPSGPKKGPRKGKGKPGKRDKVARSVEDWKITKDKVTFKSKNRDAGTYDDLSWEIKTYKEGVSTLLKYNTKESTALKAKFEWRTKLYSIIEFCDEGTAGYDKDDEVINEIVLGKDWEWLPIEDISEGDIKEFKAETDSENNTLPSFKVVGRYSGVPVQFERGVTTITLKDNTTTEVNVTESYSLDPNMIKFDYVISNYVASESNCSDPKLALEGRFRSKAKAKSYPDKQYLEAVETTDGAGGQFTWAQTADADGTDVSVLSSTAFEIPDDDSDGADPSPHKNEKIFWTFDSDGVPSSIVWDPEVVGVTGASSSGDGADADDMSSAAGKSAVAAFVLTAAACVLA